jgi:hypothetical protein
VRRKNTGVGVDDEPSSMLCVAGAAGVHGLFNWLLNQGVHNVHLPALLAPVAFRHASLCPAQLTISTAKVRDDPPPARERGSEDLEGSHGRRLKTPLRSNPLLMQPGRGDGT